MSEQGGSVEGLERSLQRVGSYVVAASLLCYGVGFVITNLYLGSMGIVSVELVRPRYVSAGILFLAFCLAIGLLVMGLVRTLRSRSPDSHSGVLSVVLSYSVTYLALLYLFAIPAVAMLGGSGLWAPGTTPSTAANLPWSEWLRLTPVRTLRNAVPLLFLGVVVVALVLIILILNPKGANGVRTPRRETLTKIANELAKIRISHVLRLGAAVATVLLLLLAGELLEFIRSGKAAAFLYPVRPDVDAGWLRFFLAISGLYLFVAALVSMFWGPAHSSTKSSPPRAAGVAYQLILFVSLGVLLTLPVYAVGVYPYLPQQLGGGLLVRVRVSGAADEMKALSRDAAATYLVDRTSTSLILLITSDGGKSREVVEVPMRAVDSLTYVSAR